MRLAAPLAAHVDPTALPEPMLATPLTWTGGGEPPAELRRDEWVYEGKWDGVRAIVAVSDGRATFVSRSGRDMTGLYPELQEVATLLHAHAAVLDGEVVALAPDGRTDFGRLQPRMTADAHDAAALAAAQPVDLFLFDVLTLTVEGKERRLQRTRYRDRRALLRQAVADGERVRVPDDLGTDLDAALATSLARRWEGVIAKRADSTYQPGRRSRAWLKVKHRPAQDVVVIGWRESSARPLASLLVAVPDAAGALRYAGRVGSGFDDAALAEISARLGPIERNAPAAPDVPAADRHDAHWVTPRLVGTAEFAEVTAQGRLRHAVWKGWRPDVDPADVTWEGA